MEEIFLIIGVLGVAVGFIALLPMLSTKRRWIVIISMLVGLASLTDGFYRLSTRDRVTTKNIEYRVREWLEAVDLGPYKVPDDRSFFMLRTQAVMGNPEITVARMKDRSRYLSLFATRTLSNDDRAAFNNLSKAAQEKFFLRLRAALAGARFSYVISAPPPTVVVTIYTRIPITNSLTEGAFLDSIDEVGLGATLANDTIELELGSAERLH